MHVTKAIGIGFASCVVLLLAIASLASAQSYFYRWDNDSGDSNWGTGQNWGRNPPLNLGVNNFTPSAYFEELGLINNGNTVNVTTSQTQLSVSAANNAVAAAGATVDGVTPTGNGSKLNIASGGTLSLLVTYGPNGAPPNTTPTAGTGNATINNLGSITVQPGGTLNVKGNIAINSGSLTVGGVAAGGLTTAGSLIEAGANSTVNLLGSATLNVTNGAVLNGTTSITGPNVVINTPGISMANTTVFSPVITSAAVAAGIGHSVINVSGGVSLNGTLRPQFLNGVVPHLGDVWTLWDSALIQGNFTASDATGAGAALPTGLRYAITTTAAGSVNGKKGQLTVENFLTAEVNRANGQVTIRNTNTTVGSGVTITGYQIGSAGGALKPSAFATAFGGAWESPTLTANSISELNPTGNSAVGLGASNSMGNVYDPVALQTTFGTTPVSDLTFSYTRSDGRTVNAPVTYVNNGLANKLVLQVDPTDGKARIINDSVFNNIKFDGYQLTSASNSLLPAWNSLQDQSVTGWEEAASTTSLLAELNPVQGEAITVNAGQTAAIMTGLFKTVGGMQDLMFQYRLLGSTTTLDGVVRYASFGGILVGDYNQNGVVDAADYVFWRHRVGGPGASLPNRDSNNGGLIGTNDYNSWRAHFGATNGAGSGALASGSSQVPELSVYVMIGILVCGLAITRSRFDSVFADRQPCLVLDS